jgi:hypothetical protein
MNLILAQMEMTMMNKIKINIGNMNQITIAILLFLGLFGTIHWIKPVLIYKPNGTLRTFGIGYRNKTVTPLWFVVFLMAILAYTISIYI